MVIITVLHHRPHHGITVLKGSLRHMAKDTITRRHIMLEKTAIINLFPIQKATSKVILTAIMVFQENRDITVNAFLKEKREAIFRLPALLVITIV